MYFNPLEHCSRVGFFFYDQLYPLVIRCALAELSNVMRASHADQVP